MGRHYEWYLEEQKKHYRRIRLSESNVRVSIAALDVRAAALGKRSKCSWPQTIPGTSWTRICIVSRFVCSLTLLFCLINAFVIRFSSRPIAEMAELTPTTWDVITDALRGLRVMADQTNRQVSRWYIEEWGPMANIVAVDFMRGTNLMETSLYWNAKKDVINNNDWGSYDISSLMPFFCFEARAIFDYQLSNAGNKNAKLRHSVDIALECWCSSILYLVLKVFVYLLAF